MLPSLKAHSLRKAIYQALGQKKQLSGPVRFTRFSKGHMETSDHLAALMDIQAMQFLSFMYWTTFDVTLGHGKTTLFQQTQNSFSLSIIARGDHTLHCAPANTVPICLKVISTRSTCTSMAHVRSACMVDVIMAFHLSSKCTQSGML